MSPLQTQIWPHLDLPDDAFASPLDSDAPAKFLALVRKLGRGAPLDDPTVQQLARACGVDTAAGHRKRPTQEPLKLPPPDLLLRIGTDLQPDLVACAPDWALGPWADGLVLEDAAHRDAMIHACALVALSDAQPPDPPLLRRHLRQERDPSSLAFREGLSHLLEVPQGLWLLDAQVGDRWRVIDLLDLDPSWSPREPILLHSIPGVEGGPPRKGDTLCARLVQTEEGPQAWVGLRVSGHPPPDPIRGWRTLCLWIGRLRTPTLPLEVALARQGHRLSRCLHEWAWTR